MVASGWKFCEPEYNGHHHLVYLKQMHAFLHRSQ